VIIINAFYFNWSQAIITTNPAISLQLLIDDPLPLLAKHLEMLLNSYA